MSSNLKNSKWIQIFSIWLWQAEWVEKRSRDCRDDFRADENNNFSPVFAALNIRNITRENQDCSRSSNAPIFCASVVKLIAVTIVKV